MTRKKKGSSLILVMMISAIFLVISSVVTTAVMTTTKANAAEQRYEDLLYGAESGIESAFARIHRGEYSNSSQNEIVSYTIDKDSSGASIFNDYIVDISINETNGNTYNVKSRAVSRNNPNNRREVSARVTKPVTASTNIFKYVLCAERMNIKAIGNIDDSVTLWSVEDFTNSEVIKFYGHSAAESLKNKLRINQVQIPDFTGADAPIHSVEVVLADATINKAELNDLASVNNSVKKVTYKTTKHPSRDIDIFLVNTNKLILEGGTINLNEVILITNGILEIKGAGDGRSGVTLNGSTYFGREFNFKLSSFTSQYRLIDNSSSAVDILNQEDVEKINELVKQYIPLWNQNTSGGGISDTTVGEFEY